MRSPALKYLIIGVATAGLLYLAFRGQDLSKAWDAISGANMYALLGGVVLMFLSHLVRAFRWQIVLRPIKKKTSLWLSFKSTIAGYGMNNLIPRSGEIVRPYLMSRGEDVHMAGVLTSVVVERLTDVIALACLMIYAALQYQSSVTSIPYFSDALTLLPIMLAVLILFILMFFSERRTTQFLRILARPLPEKFGHKISKLGHDFSQGLRGLDKTSIIPLVTGTAGIWIIYGISMYVSLMAFPETSHLKLADAFLLLTLSGIAYTIPTPGATGTYHILIKSGLSIFGISATVGLAYAIATHAFSYIFTTLAGLIFLVREGISFGAAKNMSAEMPTPILQPSDG